MTIIKPHRCNSCGGMLDIDIDRQLYICPFCGITYDYEYFREDNVLDLATRALNRCEFGSAKEAFEFALKKDPHSTKALRGIILCNNQWKNMAPLVYVEKVYLKKDDPSLLKAIENCEPENKEYFENIKNALSILDEFRWNKTEIHRAEKLRDVDQKRLSALYEAKAKNEEKFTSSARSVFATFNDIDMAGFVIFAIVALIVLIAGIFLYIGWWAFLVLFGIIAVVIAIYNITKAITSNTLDGAIAPVKEKVDKMDQDIAEKKQHGKDLRKEYDEMTKKILEDDMKFYKESEAGKDKKTTAAEDDLNLEL